MTKCLLPFAFLGALTATSVGAVSMTGTFEDRGSFDIIRLQNGEVLDVTATPLAGDNVYATIVVGGVTYTVYDRGPDIGPIYAVPN